MVRQRRRIAPAFNGDISGEPFYDALVVLSNRDSDHRSKELMSLAVGAYKYARAALCHSAFVSHSPFYRRSHVRHVRYCVHGRAVRVRLAADGGGQGISSSSVPHSLVRTVFLYPTQSKGSGSVSSWLSLATANGCQFGTNLLTDFACPTSLVVSLLGE